MGLGVLGGLISFFGGMYAMFLWVRFFGKVFGKDNRHEWEGAEKIAYYAGILMMMTVCYTLFILLA